MFSSSFSVIPLAKVDFWLGYGPIWPGWWRIFPDNHATGWRVSPPQWTKQNIGNDTAAGIKNIIVTEIAKKVPGLNPKSLSDPSNVMNLAIPQATVSQWNQIDSGITTGSTFNQVFSATGTDKQPIISKAALQADEGAAKGFLAIPAPGAGADAQTQMNYFAQVTYPQNKQKVFTEMQNLGLIPANTTSANADQAVLNAYGDLLKQSVQTGTPLNTLLNNTSGTVGNKGIADTAATGGSYGALVPQAMAALGVTMDKTTETYLESQAQQGSWSQNMVNQAVAAQFQYSPGQPLTGRAQSIYQGILSIADQYQIPLSQQGIAQWLTNSIKGVNPDPTAMATDASGDAQGTSAALAAFKQYAQQTSAGLYPTFSPQILQGVTPKTLLDPYSQLAASLLGYGSTPNSTGQSTVNQALDAQASLGINYNDPKWRVLIDGGRNPETGAPAPMSLDQARQTIISDPQYGWQNTSGAQDLASHVSDQLLQEFGFYKPGL